MRDPKVFKAFTKRMQLLKEYLRRTLKLSGNKEKGRTKERDDALGGSIGLYEYMEVL